MTAVLSLWKAQRPVGFAYGARRAVATFVLARTTPSRRLIVTWIVTVGGVLVLALGIGWGVWAVAPAHNPTLTWSTGVSLGLLAVLGFVSSSLDRPSRAERLRRGVPATAVLNPQVFAVRVEGGRVIGLRVADIGEVRWICGVVSIRSRETRKWLLFPAEVFPSRAEWVDLRRRFEGEGLSSFDEASGGTSGGAPDRPRPSGGAA